MITYKILFLGDSSVGKTAFIIRFCDGKFEEDSLTTIGLDKKAKSVSHKDKKILLQIWDTAGQERFRSIAKSCYKGADGILLMYDVNNYDSFKHIKTWIKDIKANITIPWEKLALIVIGNKTTYLIIIYHNWIHYLTTTHHLIIHHIHGNIIILHISFHNHIHIIIHNIICIT